MFSESPGRVRLLCGPFRCGVRGHFLARRGPDPATAESTSSSGDGNVGCVERSETHRSRAGRGSRFGSRRYLSEGAAPRTAPFLPHPNDAFRCAQRILHLLEGSGCFTPTPHEGFPLTESLCFSSWLLKTKRFALRAGLRLRLRACCGSRRGSVPGRGSGRTSRRSTAGTGAAAGTTCRGRGI